MIDGFYIGTFFVHFYGIILMSGALAGGWLASREAKRRGHDPDVIWDLLIYLIIGGVIGAHAPLSSQASSPPFFSADARETDSTLPDQASSTATGGPSSTRPTAWPTARPRSPTARTPSSTWARSTRTSPASPSISWPARASCRSRTPSSGSCPTIPTPKPRRRSTSASS